MATKPLTTESVALTEKKMDMTLDDIIKMTKTKVFKPKKQRVPNKSNKFARNNAQEKSAKVKRFMDSRSILRQGALAQKRSNYQGNQFPLAKEAARNAAIVPISNRPFNQGRGFKSSQMRIAGLTGQNQRKNGNGSFTVKPQGYVMHNQRTQTLDSRFSNLKEQRMRTVSQHNNNGGRQNGGGSQRQQQWRRGPFGNN